MKKRQPMAVTSREVTLRDFLTFQLKLTLDGLMDFVVFNASIVAMLLDFVAGRGRRPRLFYSVVRASERFDAWLELHSVVERLDESGGDDGSLTKSAPSGSQSPDSATPSGGDVP